MIKISIEEKLIVSILGLLSLIKNNPNSNILKNDYIKYKLAMSQPVPEDAVDVYKYLKMCYEKQSITNTQYSSILNILQSFRTNINDVDNIIDKMRKILGQLGTKMTNTLESDLRLLLKCFVTNSMDSSKLQSKLFNYASRKSMDIDFMKYANMMSKE